MRRERELDTYYERDREAELDDIYQEHIRDQVCPRCGHDVEMAVSPSFVEIVCRECGWIKEVR